MANDKTYVRDLVFPYRLRDDTAETHRLLCSRKAEIVKRIGESVNSPHPAYVITRDDIEYLSPHGAVLKHGVFSKIVDSMLSEPRTKSSPIKFESGELVGRAYIRELRWPTTQLKNDFGVTSVQCGIPDLQGFWDHYLTTSHNQLKAELMETALGAKTCIKLDLAEVSLSVPRFELTADQPEFIRGLYGMAKRLIDIATVVDSDNNMVGVVIKHSSVYKVTLWIDNRIYVRNFAYEFMPGGKVRLSAVNTVTAITE